MATNTIDHQCCILVDMYVLFIFIINIFLLYFLVFFFLIFLFFCIVCIILQSNYDCFYIKFIRDKKNTSINFDIQFQFKTGMIVVKLCEHWKGKMDVICVIWDYLFGGFTLTLLVKRK